MLTQEYLKKILTYDPETGLFTWNVHRGRQSAGSPAGNINNRGYMKIKIHGKQCLSHRLAFLYMSGRIPKYIDHINRDRADNRWVNIREASHHENMFNTPLHIDNKSGVRGVHWRKREGKWIAIGTIKGKQFYLGMFTDIADAASARSKFELEHHKQFRSKNDRPAHPR